MSIVLGYRKDGRPILPIKGGSEPAVETGIQVPVDPPKPEVKPAPTPEVKTYTAEDIERARQQEKDKLYSRIEELSSTVKSLKQTEDERAAEVKRKADEKAAEAERKRQEDASAKELLNDAQKTWEQRFQEMQQQYEQEKLLREKEAEFHELQQYIQKRVSEESDNIAPELLELVEGNNPQEVEASIGKLRAATEKLVESISATAQQVAPAPRGVPVTGYGPVGGPGDDSSQTRTISNEELKNIPVGSKEYLDLRARLGIGGGGQGRGLFG